MTEIVLLASYSMKEILRGAHFPNPLVSMAQYELCAPRVDPNVTIRQPATLSQRLLSVSLNFAGIF